MVTTATASDGTERFTFFFTFRDPFSQWHPSRFVVDGATYENCEQFMMAEKARLFGDAASLRMVMGTSDPKRAKELGRGVVGFSEARWRPEVPGILTRGNAAKFSQDAKLGAALAATVGTTLVEASPYDRIYGIGLPADDPRALSRATWRGRNVLGDVLTRLRVSTLGA